jgi:hypothetical protein
MLASDQKPTDDLRISGKQHNNETLSYTTRHDATAKHKLTHQFLEMLAVLGFHVAAHDFNHFLEETQV